MRLTVQEFNNLFSFLGNDKSNVLWIRDLADTRQIYVSPGYNHVWQRNREELYEDPMTFNETVIVEDHSSLDAFYAKSHRDRVGNTYFYRCRQGNGNVIWLKDCNAQIIDSSGQAIAMAGMAQSISESQWLYETLDPDCSSEPINDEFNKLQEILKKELNLSMSNKKEAIESRNSKNNFAICIDDNNITLSHREAQCIYYTLLGYSTKQTAQLLFISDRTVETYHEHLKNKFQCRTKLEIINKILSNKLQVEQLFQLNEA